MSDQLLKPYLFNIIR